MMATEVWDCEFIQKSNELQVSFYASHASS
jgi:hypothetical protein